MLSWTGKITRVNGYIKCQQLILALNKLHDPSVGRIHSGTDNLALLQPPSNSLLCIVNPSAGALLHMPAIMKIIVGGATGYREADSTKSNEEGRE